MIDAAMLARNHEVVPYPWDAVDAVAELEAIPSAACEPRIGLAVFAGGSTKPFIEFAGRNVDRPAKDLRWPRVAMRAIEAYFTTVILQSS